MREGGSAWAWAVLVCEGRIGLIRLREYFWHFLGLKLHSSFFILPLLAFFLSSNFLPHFYFLLLFLPLGDCSFTGRNRICTKRSVRCHACVSACVYVHACECMCVCVRVPGECMCICAHVCGCNVFACVSACVCLHAYLSLCMCM